MNGWIIFGGCALVFFVVLSGFLGFLVYWLSSKAQEDEDQEDKEDV